MHLSPSLIPACLPTHVLESNGYWHITIFVRCRHPTFFVVQPLGSVQSLPLNLFHHVCYEDFYYAVKTSVKLIPGHSLVGLPIFCHFTIAIQCNGFSYRYLVLEDRHDNSWLSTQKGHHVEVLSVMKK